MTPDIAIRLAMAVVLAATCAALLALYQHPLMQIYLANWTIC